MRLTSLLLLAFFFTPQSTSIAQNEGTLGFILVDPFDVNPVRETSFEWFAGAVGSTDGLSFVSPGGTENFGLFSSFQDFEADVFGTWTVSDDFGNEVLFDIAPYSLNEIDRTQIAFPNEGLTVNSGDIVTFQLETSSSLFMDFLPFLNGSFVDDVGIVDEQGSDELQFLLNDDIESGLAAVTVSDILDYSFFSPLVNFRGDTDQISVIEDFYQIDSDLLVVEVVNAVPEPNTTCFLFGSIALIASRRRRK